MNKNFYKMIKHIESETKHVYDNLEEEISAIEETEVLLMSIYEVAENMK